MPGLSESDTRAKLIDPAIHERGWTEDLIRREETAGAIEIGAGQPRRQARGRIDYMLRVKVNRDTQPVAVALIEAKAEDLPPDHGLEQAKLYAACKRLNVPFVFCQQRPPVRRVRPLHRPHHAARARWPSSPRPPTCAPATSRAWASPWTTRAAAPAAARATPAARRTRRYYQDAAIRAVLEKIARCEARQPSARCSRWPPAPGKTFIAVNLLKRIADAGQLRRALFVCDRDELRSQGARRRSRTSSAPTPPPCPAATRRRTPASSIATYQTLDVDTDDADANFLLDALPGGLLQPHHHRRVPPLRLGQVVAGADAQPRRRPDRPHGHAAPARVSREKTKEAQADAEITADNLRYFGEPVYEYDMARASRTATWPPARSCRLDVFLDDKTANERETGVDAERPGGQAADRRHHRRAGRPGRGARPLRRRQLRGPAAHARARGGDVPQTCSTTCSPPAARSRRPSSSAPATATPTTSPRR